MFTPESDAKLWTVPSAEGYPGKNQWRITINLYNNKNIARNAIRKHKILFTQYKSECVKCYNKTFLKGSCWKDYWVGGGGGKLANMGYPRGGFFVGTLKLPPPPPPGCSAYLDTSARLIVHIYFNTSLIQPLRILIITENYFNFS